MSGYRTYTILFSGAVVLALLAIMFLALQVTVTYSQESDEIQLERERAMAAEQPGFAANQPLPQLTEATIYPLFMGVDDAAIPAYTMDPSTNISATAFSGAEVWGAAYDPFNEIVYFNSGSTLYEWPLGGTINPLGTIVDASANTQVMVGLAFYAGQLYGTKNIANEAIWVIDTDTLVATVHIDYVDADLDLGGLAVNPLTGQFYATNDDSTPYGASLVRINPGGTATVIAPYPMGQTDIDGLAISDDGVAYMIIDEPGSIYVYDLNTNTYLPPLTNPWTTSEVFAAGTYIYSINPEIEVHPTKLQTLQPPDTQIVRQLTISNTGFADLEWAIEEENELTALLPAAAAPPPYVAGSHPPSAGAVPAANGDNKLAPAPDPSLLNQIGSLIRAWNSQNGPYFTIFDSNSPQVLPLIAAFPAGGNFIGAGEYVGGLSYMVDSANNVYVVDDTGALQDQYTATAPPGSQAYSGMALDPLTGNVYAASTSVVTSTLFTFDVLTGNATQVGPIDGSPANIAISFDGAGNLFGYDIDNNSFMQIDPATGNTSNVVPLPFDANFGQGMLYDPATDLLYMLAFNSGTFQAEFWTVDTSDPSVPVFSFIEVLGSSVPGGLNQLSWGGTASCAPTDLPWVSTDPLSGMVPAGAGMPVDVTFDATGLATGVYTGTLCIKNSDPTNALVRIPLTMTIAAPSIALTKTVGLDPALCATGNTLDVTTGPGGLQVTYCYEVTNTGVFTLSSHDLFDDQLGAVLSGFPYDLAPGASVFLTSTAQITQTTVNSATWTAVDVSDPVISATATATATVNIRYGLYLPFIANSGTNAAAATPPTHWTAPILTPGLLTMVAAVRGRMEVEP